MKKYLKSEGDSKQVYEVSKLCEFVELVTWMSLDGKIVFRGQTRDWPLIPSVGRCPERSLFLSREYKILDEFKRESVPYLNIQPKNDWQWLSVAQHNRLPTRLLDWSKNPLAALWFSVKDPAAFESPSIVWCLNYIDKEAIYNTEKHDSPFDIDQLYLYFPEHVFPSIEAQGGVFTVHYREDENDSKFRPLEEIYEDEPKLVRIQIAPSFVPTLRYQLFRVGISPASLFPGISGIVDKIRYDNMKCEDEVKS